MFWVVSAFARAIAAVAAVDKPLEELDVCEARYLVLNRDDLSVMMKVYLCCLDPTVVVISLLAWSRDVVVGSDQAKRRYSLPQKVNVFTVLSSVYGWVVYFDSEVNSRRTWNTNRFIQCRKG